MTWAEILRNWLDCCSHPSLLSRQLFALCYYLVEQYCTGTTSYCVTAVVASNTSTV